MNYNNMHCKIKYIFFFFSGSKPVTGTRRVRVTSKAKDCWNKVSWIILARVNLKEEIGYFVCSSCSVISHFVAWNLGKFVALLKGTTKSRKKKVFWREKFVAFLKGDRKKSKKKSFSGKIVPRKKGLWFWMVSGFESKIYQVFWREKSCPVQNDFSHRRSKYMFDFWQDSVQKRRTFFLLGNPT